MDGGGCFFTTKNHKDDKKKLENQKMTPLSFMQSVIACIYICNGYIMVSLWIVDCGLRVPQELTKLTKLYNYTNKFSSRKKSSLSNISYNNNKPNYKTQIHTQIY